jgi:hypothetical protein
MMRTRFGMIYWPPIVVHFNTGYITKLAGGRKYPEKFLRENQKKKDKHLRLSF